MIREAREPAEREVKEEEEFTETRKAQFDDFQGISDSEKSIF